MFLFIKERAAFGNTMPFFQAATATGRRRVLRDEDGMVSHGRLFAVIDWLRRGQTLLYKISSVFEDDFDPFALKIISLLTSQAKTPAECRTFQSGKKLI